MKKNGLILMVFAAVFCCISSCKKEKEDLLENWMIANLEAFNAIKTNPEYKELASPGNEGSIYYKVLNKGDGTDPIQYSSAVGCYYTGYFAADYPELAIRKGTVFDKRLFNDGPAFYFTIAGSVVIGGWKTAIQHMVKGDKWEIWIPYQLAYGRTGKGDLPGFSTLVFEIEVVDVLGVDNY